MSSKMIILLYVYCESPYYNRLSIITRSVSMDPKDSGMMRLTYTLLYKSVDYEVV